MSTIGERLKKERERLDFTQEVFGRKTGITKQTQINYEKGARKPSVEYLKLAYEAGVDITYVVVGVRTGKLAGSFESKLALLKFITARLMNVVEQSDIKPDISFLPEIRDFAVRAQLNEEMLVEFVRLLVEARDIGKWMD